jgi:glycosyltransferase involved in cell wall biosynthesis
MQPITIVNVADLSPGEPFVDVQEYQGRTVRWIHHSGLPQNALERVVRRPRLARYRAAAAGACDARGAQVLISHLPRMTAALQSFAGWAAKPLPHLAFSFNFTKLPRGVDKARLRAAFVSISQFCVYSQHEVSRYAEAFNLPEERFRPITWAQDPPPIDRDVARPASPFVAVIGGEGRDFATVIAAAKATPGLRWIVIARPHALLTQVPSNVTVHVNLPLAKTWGLASHATAVVVPLLSEETCCGHITIATTQQLGIPLITTRSRATEEYVAGFAATKVLPPGEPDALASAATQVALEPESARARAIGDQAEARRRYHRNRWDAYVRDFLARCADVGS